MKGSLVGRATPRRWGRGLLLVLAVGAMTLLVVAAITVPTSFARNLLARQAEAIGVELQGVETVSFDLLGSAIEAGPLRFSVPGAPPGEIGPLRLRYAPLSLALGRILVESMVVEGADLRIVRRPDGALMVNGVDLQRLMAARSGGEAGRWLVGVDRLEMRAGQAVLEDVNGGTLALDLRRLGLGGFRAWEPESPGAFELDAAFNGVDVRLAGEVSPFTDVFVASGSGEVAGVTVERVRRFTGPMGFSRRQGELASRLDVRFTVDPTNAWRLGTRGNFTFDGVEVATEAGVGAAVATANLDVDIETTYDRERGLALFGVVGVDIDAFRFADGRQVSVSIEDIEFKGSEVAVARAGSLVVTAPAAVRPGAAGTAQVPSLARQLVTLITTIARRFVEGGLDGKFTGTVSAKGIELKAVGRDGSATLEGRLGALRSDFDGLEARQIDKIRSVTGGLSTKVDDLTAEMALPDRTTSISWDQLTLAVPELSGKRDAGSMTAALVGSLSASRLSAATKIKADGTRQEVNVESLALELPTLSGKAAADGTNGSGRLKATLSNFDALNTAKGSAGTLTGKSLRVSLSDLAVEAGRAQDVTRLAGDLEASEIRFSDPRSGRETKISAGGGRVAFGPVVIVRESEIARLESEIKGRLSNLRAEIVTHGGPALAGAEGLSVSLSPLKLRQSREGLALDLSGSARGAMLTADLPDLGRTPPVQARATGLDIALSQVGLEETKDAARWRIAADLEASDLALEMAGESRSKLKADRVTLKNVRSDQTSSVRISDVLVGDIDLAVSRRLITRFAAPKKAPSARPAGPPRGPAVSVARVRMTPGSRLRFRDSIVDPPVEVRVLLSELDLRNIDLADPTKRSDIRLALDFEGLGGLNLEGWVKLLKSRPDFEVSGEVRKLPLPILAPYSAERMGLNVDGGMLSGTVKTKARDGRLDGAISLTIDRLDFEELSEEDKRRISNSLGDSADLVVGLLEDSDRQIVLTLPLSGTTAQPKIDFSSAVGQAVRGTLAAIFPPNVIAALLASDPGEGVEFNPILFRPGSSKLGPAGRRLADQIAVLLAERPNLDIVVCGRATASDLTAKDKIGNPKLNRSDLAGLADRRTAAVRGYLTRQRSVPFDRVGECRPKVLPDDQGPPRVDWYL